MNPVNTKGELTSRVRMPLFAFWRVLGWVTPESHCSALRSEKWYFARYKVVNMALSMLAPGVGTLFVSCIPMKSLTKGEMCSYALTVLVSIQKYLSLRARAKGGGDE